MKRVQRLLLWVGLLALGQVGALRAAAPPPVDADERELERMGVATDDVSLLRFLRQRAEAAEDASRISELISDLAHDNFERREEAMQRLVLQGKRAEAELRRHLADDDLERRRRVKRCLEGIDRGPPTVAALHVVRLLGRRDPPGATRVLLAYLPTAPDEDTEEAVYYALAATALGKEEPAVVAALQDPMASRRAVAGCLLGLTGKSDYREAVRKLLADGDVKVRLRSAQGLMAGGDKAGLPVLVELLRAESREVAWQAEELLRYAAGGDSPTEVVGKGTTEERRRCQAAWRRWLGGKGAAVDLATARQSGRRPGLILACEWWGNYSVIRPRKDPPKDLMGAVRLCGCEGQPRCDVMTFDEFKAAYPPLANPRRLAVCSEVLPLGLTGEGRPEHLEWVRFGAKDHRGRLVARLADGRILVPLPTAIDDLDRCVELDSEGRVLWELVSEGPVAAFVLCPLVRFGFTGKGTGVNLDTPEHRLAMMQHPDQLMRHAGVRRLRDLPRTDAEIGPLAEAIGKEDPFVRGIALELLPEAGPMAAPAIPGLVRLLSDDDARVRGGAAHVLSRCGARAIDPLLNAYDTPVGRNRAARRADAIWALAHQPDPANLRLHTALQGAFVSDDPAVRSQVCQGLGKAGALARPYVVQIARHLEDADENVRWCSVLGLEMLGEDAREALPLIDKYVHGAPKARWWALRAYGSVGRNDPRVASALVKLLEAEAAQRPLDEIVRAMSCHQGEEGLKRIVPALVKALKEKRDWRVQYGIAGTFGRMGARARSAVPALKEFVAASADSAGAAGAAMESLKRIDPVAAREALTSWWARHPGGEPDAPATVRFRPPLKGRVSKPRQRQILSEGSFFRKCAVSQGVTTDVSQFDPQREQVSPPVP